MHTLIDQVIAKLQAGIKLRVHACGMCGYVCAEAGYIGGALMASVDRWVLAQGEVTHG